MPHPYLHNFLNAWRLEAERLKRKGLPALCRQNELIWWYSLSGLFALGFSLAFGWLGLAFFLGQSFAALTLLEIVNYIEHYGLTRRHLGEGKYEHVLPRHSWNADLKASNWLLINLQRHSDHHYKPDRRFPV